jgi:hypothetical protein
MEKQLHTAFKIKASNWNNILLESVAYISLLNEVQVKRYDIWVLKHTSEADFRQQNTSVCAHITLIQYV